MSCLDGRKMKLNCVSVGGRAVRAQNAVDYRIPMLQTLPTQFSRPGFAPYLWEQTVALLGAVVQQLASNWLAQGTVKMFSGAAESNQMEVTLMTFVYALLFWVFINRGLFRIREYARSFTEHLTVVNRSAAPLGKFRC